jgi:hypothetical protein
MKARASKPTKSKTQSSKCKCLVKLTNKSKTNPISSKYTVTIDRAGFSYRLDGL